MVRKLVCIAICMLLCVTTGVVAGTETQDGNAGKQHLLENNIQNRDIWDVQFVYDVGGMVSSLYLGGCVFDGTFFYAPEWNSANIYKFDRDGNYIEAFTIPGVTALRDLEYDGEYVYGSNGAGLFLWQMNFTSKTLVSTMTMPVAARSCAYDADNDAFWINVWASDLVLVSRSGTILDTLTAPESLYGSAWDGFSQVAGYAGPFLWVFTGTSTGMDGIIKQYDLATKTLTGVQHNVAQDLGAGIAGGLFFTTEYESGYGTLGGIVQGADPVSDYLFGYEVCTTIINDPPATPAAPVGPDSGVIDVEYAFIAATTDPEGDQIYYWFDWDDGTNSGWLGPFASGAPVTATHIWTAAGSYDVTVQAKDEAGHLSGFSPAHTITIIEGPILEIAGISGGLLKVSATVKNTGAATADNIQWSIGLEGGIILMGKQTNGSILALEAGAERTITSGNIIGFGKTVVTVTATVPVSQATEQTNATVLLFFIRIK